MQYRIDHEDFTETYTKQEIQFFIDHHKITIQTKIWIDGENKWIKVKDSEFDISKAKYEPESGLPDNLFLSIRSILSGLDKGTIIIIPFRWMYNLNALLSLLTPFILYFFGVKNNILEMPSKYVYSFYIMIFIVMIISWMTFQLWWDRKSKINKLFNDGDEFIATHLFAHSLQTIGEYLGIWIGIGGFFIYLLVYIVTRNENDYYMYQIGYFYNKTSLITVFLYPIFGILCIATFRMFSEVIRALPAIANNTKNSSKSA